MTSHKPRKVKPLPPPLLILGVLWQLCGLLCLWLLWHRWRGNDALQGVLKCDAVQSQIFGCFGHGGMIPQNRRSQNLFVLIWYQEAIELFHDILKQAAHAQSQYDEISKSENYFTSLPHSITPEITGISLATIGFQKQTNILFSISIKGDAGPTRPLRISCDSGLIEIHPDGETVSILLNSPAFPVLNVVKDVKTEE